jgi:hypothetical protein
MDISYFVFLESPGAGQTTAGSSGHVVINPHPGEERELAISSFAVGAASECSRFGLRRNASFCQSLSRANSLEGGAGQNLWPMQRYVPASELLQEHRIHVASVDDQLEGVIIPQ